MVHRACSGLPGLARHTHGWIHLPLHVVVHFACMDNLSHATSRSLQFPHPHSFCPSLPSPPPHKSCCLCYVSAPKGETATAEEIAHISMHLLRTQASSSPAHGIIRRIETRRDQKSSTKACSAENQDRTVHALAGDLRNRNRDLCGKHHELLQLFTRHQRHQFHILNMQL